MLVRITRPWRVPDLPLAHFDPDQVFDVRPSLAKYLLAMKCAEPLQESGKPGSSTQHGKQEYEAT